MIWFGFLGMFIGIKRDLHMRLSFIYDAMTPWMRSILDLVNNLLILCWGLVLTVYG